MNMFMSLWAVVLIFCFVSLYAWLVDFFSENERSRFVLCRLRSTASDIAAALSASVSDA